MIKITVKRVFETQEPTDGYRALVDRLWPRGVSKSDAHLDAWWKRTAPSTDLRKWFGHDPAKWMEFRQRYAEELEPHAELVRDQVFQAQPGPLTLVYAATDEQHNHAVVLKEFIERRILDP